jgi:peptidoglycan/LPS O-acetylase OafA/YrhL
VTVNAEMLRALPRTFWLFAGGAAAIALGSFFPLASDSDGGVAGLNSGGTLIFLLCAGGIAYLAWPTMRELPLTAGRRWGIVAITAFVGLIVVLVWYALVSHSDSSVSVGAGQLLATIGVVCSTIGLVRIWRETPVA